MCSGCRTAIGGPAAAPYRLDHLARGGIDADHHVGVGLDQSPCDLAFAGSDMEQEFGGDMMTMSGLEALGRALKSRREAIARGDVKESPPEVIAKRQRALAKEKVRSRCMGECRKTCRDTCDAKVRAKFPNDETADDKEAAEMED